MCVARVVSLRELEARDEAVATRHDHTDERRNVDMFTCIYNILSIFLKCHQELDGRVQVNIYNMIKKKKYT
jgi:hypothetical protein